MTIRCVAATAGWSACSRSCSGCSAFVVLAGRDGVRRWVGAEVQVALIRHLSPAKDDDRLPIFPILLEDAQAGNAAAVSGAVPGQPLDGYRGAAGRADRRHPRARHPPRLAASHRGLPLRRTQRLHQQGFPAVLRAPQGNPRSARLPRRPAAGRPRRPARRWRRRLLPLAADRGQQRHRQVVAGQRRHAADDRTGRAVGAHRLRALDESSAR
jgi:hypothetical protein